MDEEVYECRKKQVFNPVNSVCVLSDQGASLRCTTDVFIRLAGLLSSHGTV